MLYFAVGMCLDICAFAFCLPHLLFVGFVAPLSSPSSNVVVRAFLLLSHLFFQYNNMTIITQSLAQDHDHADLSRFHHLDHRSCHNCKHEV